MVLFVNALGGQASFTISLATLTPVAGVTWSFVGLPAIPGSGVVFSTSDDTGCTFTAFRGFTNDLTSMSVRATLDDSTTASATFNISSGSGATLPAINPLAVLPVMDGLAAWYDGPSWNGVGINKYWLDKSGNGNNTSPADVRGVITYDSTNGFLYGGVNDGLKFPSLGTTTNYTFIHLARYKDGVKQRIFQGVSTDWASGFYAGKAGVAYHNGYITAPTDLYGYNWVISSDQRNLYRSHSVDFTSGTAGSPGYPNRIGLNFGAATSEYSEWAVAEVLIYNRVLSAAEMLSVENYLRVKYPSLTIQIDTTTGASFTIPQSNQSGSIGTVNWTYKTPLPTGVSFVNSTQGGATFSIATGTFLNNQNLVVNASGNGGGGTRSIYLLAASRALLTAPNVAFNTTIAGSFTVLQTASGTGGITWAYSNLPTSVTFLSSSDSGLTFTVAQNAVVATRTITVTATNGVKTPTVATFTYGSGVKPVLAVGTVSAIDSTTQQTFLVPQTVVDGLTGGITWSYTPAVFPTGLTVSATNQGATFTVAQNAVIAQQTITATATNMGGVSTTISFTVGAAVKPVLVSANQLLNTSAALKQFTITVQAPSVTYSGGITWSYTLPTGLTFVTSTNGLITFQVARSVVITSRSFSVTATNSVGTPTTATFTLGAGTPPVLSDPANGTGELILDTTSINRTFTVVQQSNNTGTITWAVSPSTYPAGVSIQTLPEYRDFGLTMLLLQGSVLPYQPFTFTASAASGFIATRSFNLGASTLVELQGPGDPQLIDTTTQQTVQVSQIYDPAYTGTVTWTITPSSYPAGISITTQDDSKTIITFNANSYLLRQQFVFTARSVGGLTSTVRFDIGAAVRPTLTSLANQVLDTSTVQRQFSVTQQVNTAYTGPITWIVTPATLPGGATKVTSDSLITFTVPAQTSTTGVIWPNTPFSVTAKNTNTGYSSVPTTFNVFAPRLPVVNAMTTGLIIDVSTTAYTVAASQSKPDAAPVAWTITKGDGSAVPTGVSINSSSGLITVTVGSYFVATVLKPIATNSAGAVGSTTFTLTTPEPPIISGTPPSPQILNVTAGQQQLTFTLTNSGLAGNISWSFGDFVPPAGVTLTAGGGLLTIPKDTYFASTVFTIRATNTGTNVNRERTITINTPQTPAIDTLAPVSPQILNVTSTAKKFTFTNSITLARPVEWSLPTNPQSGAVTINAGTGEVTVAAGQYFLSSSFVVQASNAAINVVNTRSFVINAPAPPAFTATYASGVYVNTTAAAATLPFTSTEARADPVAWSLLQSDGVTAAPAGVTINGTTGTVTVNQNTFFLGLGLKVMASNVAISSTTSLTPYFVSAPKTPVLNTTLTIPTPTYKPIVVYGGVTTVTSLNSAGTSIPAQANQTYTSVDSTATSGVGGGATFTVTRNGSGAVTVGLVSVAFYGLGYVTGNTVKILGTALGGTTPANDVTITVAASTSVYMNNSTTSNVIQVSQTASPTGTITWGGVSSLPTGVNITDILATNSLLSVTVTSGTVVRPKLALNLTVSAAGPALQGVPGGLVSGNVVFDIFTPLRPIIGTPADNANFSFDTTSTSQSVTITQDAAQTTADTGPITWDFVSPTYEYVTQTLQLTVVFTPRSLIITVPQGTYGITGVDSPYYGSITVRAINPARMASTANKTFNLYVPNPPAWVVRRTDTTAIIADGTPITFDSSGTTPFTFTATQTVSTSPINRNGITYTAPSPVSPITLSTGTATISQSGDVYTITVSQDAVTSGQSITFSAKNSTNDMNRTVSRTISFICAGPPVIAATTTWTPAASSDVYEFDTKTAAITIDAKYTSGLPLATITTNIPPTGLTFVAGSSTSTQSTFTIAKEANIAAAVIQLKLATAAMASGTYVTKNFTINAAAQPTLGSPTQTGTLDTTTGVQIITITAATSPKSIVTDWTFTASDGSVLSTLGITVTKVTGDTSGGLVKLTITIAKTTSFTARNFTATAKTCVSTITRSQTFSLGALYYIAPTLAAPGAQNLNTSAGAGTYTVTQTAGTAVTSWSITKSDGSAVPSSITINSSGVISIAASTKLSALSVIVTATNSAGSGSTNAFSLSGFFVRFVGVSTGGGGAYTIDDGQTIGHTWGTSDLPSDAWSGVARNPITNRYAAVSYGGATASSANGINWSTRPPPPDEYLTGCACSPTTGRFVSGTRNNTTGLGAAAYSNDGITWQVAAFPSIHYPSFIAVNSSGRFVIAGYGDNMGMYSNDGITWVPMTITSQFDSVNFTCVGGSPISSKFVALRLAAGGFYSNDGITWARSNLPDGFHATAVTCNGAGVWAAVGDTTQGPSGYKSTDGINWSEVTVGSVFSSNYWSGVSYNTTNNLFQAVSRDGVTSIGSSDGTGWSEITGVPPMTRISTA